MHQLGLFSKAVHEHTKPKGKQGRPPKRTHRTEPATWPVTEPVTEPVTTPHRIGAAARNRMKTNARVSRLEQRVAVLEQQLERCMRAGGIGPAVVVPEPAVAVPETEPAEGGEHAVDVPEPEPAAAVSEPAEGGEPVPSGAKRKRTGEPVQEYEFTNQAFVAYGSIFL